LEVVVRICASGRPADLLGLAQEQSGIAPGIGHGGPVAIIVDNHRVLGGPAATIGRPKDEFIVERLGRGEADLIAAIGPRTSDQLDRLQVAVDVTRTGGPANLGEGTLGDGLIGPGIDGRGMVGTDGEGVMGKRSQGGTATVTRPSDAVM